MASLVGAGVVGAGGGCAPSCRKKAEALIINFIVLHQLILLASSI